MGIEWGTWDFWTRTGKNGPLVPGDYRKTEFSLWQDLSLSLSLSLSHTHTHTHTHTLGILWWAERNETWFFLWVFAFHVHSRVVVKSCMERCKRIQGPRRSWSSPLYSQPLPRQSLAQGRYSGNLCWLNECIPVCNGKGGGESWNVLQGLFEQKPKDKALLKIFSFIYLFGQAGS